MQQPINANDSTFAVLPVGVSLRLELINKAKTKKTNPDSKFEFRGTSEGEGGLPASQTVVSFAIDLYTQAALSLQCAMVLY